MLQFDNDVQRLKFEVLREVCKSAVKGTLKQDIFKIPEVLCPGPAPKMRCCIYKERAIVSARIARAMGGDPDNPNIVEVMKLACDECPVGGYQVTQNCRGCIAHNCQKACRMGAITFDPLTKRCIIDKSKCVNCGMCAKACQFHAIQDFERPCESACKVKAIHADETGAADIDNEKCIRCGACVYSCPFGAIVEKSQVVDIIESLKDVRKNGKYNFYALLAPAFAAQIQKETVEQFFHAVSKLGFTRVIEVAAGADIVARDESKELAEKGFLTSSCCPAFVNFIKKNYPQLKDNISHNPSPMVALTKLLKDQDPTCKVCFIGPCIAKKGEGQESGIVDYVMTFEELFAMFPAFDVHVTKEEDQSEIKDASYYGRIFARLGGVSEAAVQAAKEQNLDFEIKAIQCDGIDNIKQGLAKAQLPTRDFNFLEGMMCNGGCIGGPANITHEVKDKVEIDTFAKTASIKSIKEGIKESAKLAAKK